MEVVIGNDLNEENEAIFNEFMDEFAEYIVMQSGPQTVLLGENFFANEEEITEKNESMARLQRYRRKLLGTTVNYSFGCSVSTGQPQKIQSR